MKSSDSSSLCRIDSRTWLACVLLLTSCAEQMNVSEKMMWSTYPLATQKGAATGFVINLPDAQAPHRVLPVIFTSVHVLDTVGRGPLIIGIRKQDEKGESQVSLLAFVPPVQQGKERFYARHPKHDLAAFALHLPAELTGHAEMSSFLNQRMLARNGRLLRSGVEVSFLGLS